MKARLQTVTDSDGVSYDALMFVCPGCASAEGPGTGLHMLPVNSETKSPSWDWNGDLESPTLKPSILTRGVLRCHSFLTDGVFNFLNDSTHELAGQSAPLPDLPEWADEMSEDEDPEES